jgi:hypothetical protein
LADDFLDRFSTYTPLFILNESLWHAILFKAILAFSKVTFVASTALSLEIPTFL